jgi:hypothetical protein
MAHVLYSLSKAQGMMAAGGGTLASGLGKGGRLRRKMTGIISARRVSRWPHYQMSGLANSPFL